MGHLLSSSYFLLFLWLAEETRSSSSWQSGVISGSRSCRAHAGPSLCGLQWTGRPQEGAVSPRNYSRAGHFSQALRCTWCQCLHFDLWRLMKLLITLYKQHQSSWKQKKKILVSQTRHDEGLMNLGLNSLMKSHLVKKSLKKPIEVLHFTENHCP